ncbi:MAG: HAD-IB family hydrolase [Acidimicrobiia bacterium]
MAAQSGRVVVVFDFDKTLSTRDNVVPFLVAALGRSAVGLGLLRSIPDLLRGRRDAVKARFVRALAGRDEQEIRAVAARIAADVLARHLRPDVVARAAWHRREGHDVVIVSASFSWYLEPIASALGIDHVLATGLEVADGRLTGALVGPNVRRAEKVRRLEVWLGGTPARIWAYGDSGGDRELLARADVAMRVGRAPLSAAPLDVDPDDIAADRPGPDSASGTGRVAP